MDDENWEESTYMYISNGGVRNFVRENSCMVIGCRYKVTETWVLNHDPVRDPRGQGTWRYYVLGDVGHHHPDPDPVGAKVAA